MKCDVWKFFENLPRKFKFHYNWTRTTSPLRGGRCTFMTISHLILGRMRNTKQIKTYILHSITFSWKSCHLWDNVEKYGKAGHATGDNIIWCMCFTCQITKDTDTHSEYVILIAFPRQQGLCERASTLRYITLHILLYVISFSQNTDS
jgi:hypothetical protein